ncbi:GDP-mannose 4,6-dehydratase [Candidatus Sumerlaeota bacterium]|nr:GDP-mannose 4,6-dehydratase [Candidatus Sumerlaeota bacterium]
MKAIVTGAAGFIGSTLSEEILRRGGSVIGIDCFTDYYSREIKERNLRAVRQNPKFQFVEKSILDINLVDYLDGVDAIFHQAAQAGVRASWGKDFKVYTDWNILGTQQLLEAVRSLPENKRPRFVYASSSSVYGERDNFPFYETDRPQPMSPYGVSKLAAEHLAVLYWTNFKVHTASLRYFTVYGPRQRPDMAFHKFIRAVYKDEALPLYGDGLQTRDFTYISDAVAANLAAAENSAPGGVYNIGGGSRVTVNHCFDVLKKVMDREIKIKHLEKQHGDVSHTAAATELAERELKWTPKVGLEEGLRAESLYVKDLMADGL